MQKKKKLIICICLLMSFSCLADPVKKTFYEIPEGTTKDTAIAFIKKYDGHLSRGMSLKDLNKYWSVGKLEEFNAVARNIANISGNSQFVERQRLIDIEHIKATCRNPELVKVTTTWRIHRKAKLIYAVKSLCNNSEEPTKRVISMMHNRGNNKWFIQSITYSDE